MRKFDAILESGQKRSHVYQSLGELSPERSRRKSLQGWRFGAVNCAVSASVIFLVNLVITIVCSTYQDQRAGSLYVGDCEKVRKINSGVHLLINGLSTVLLSSSNYCMQCLSAPTRQDVDAAHARGKWLDIGVLSIRNLRCISKKRVILWGLLGLSSLPLHLLYNSVVFMTIANYRYNAFAVSQSFINSANCDHCDDMYTEGSASPQLKGLHQKAYEGRLERLENRDCINKYAQMIQSSRGNLLLVVKDSGVPPKKSYSGTSTSTWRGMRNTSSVFWELGEPSLTSALAKNPYHWICSTLDSDDICTKDIDRVRTNAANWTVGYSCGHDSSTRPPCDVNMKGPIQYCLSEKTEQKCQIGWSTEISVIVVILNFFKAALMFYTAFGIKEEPLMSLGDAVASFLERPDPTTINMCLASQFNVITESGHFRSGPEHWWGKRYHWRHAASRRRRALMFLLILGAIASIAHLLRMGIEYIKESASLNLKSIASMGFGAIDPRALLQIEIGGVLNNTLVANIAQVIISVIYFSYNSLFTCMLLGYEWTTYAYKRKGLRVTTGEHGSQRSSYFLSLPYRFALPLMGISALMHWLVSQSIFFVAIETHDINSTYTDTTYTCGFSPIAMITGLVLGLLMLAVGFGVGYIPHKPDTNLVGSCSAAMSAACHPLPAQRIKGRDLATKKLQWGVVGVWPEDGLGHCAFSAEPVEKLQNSGLYAGS